MKNLKKLLAVLVVVTLLATSMIPAFAAGSYTYTTQAQALYDLGLYKGSSTTTFEPNLGGMLDRQQGVVMLIRLLGKESAALALTSSEVEATLIIFSDAKNLASWAKKHIAYAVLYKLVAGLPNGTFAPNNALTGKEYCTMLLRALGYTVDAAGYAGACYQLNLVGGITFSEAAKFNDKELTRDDFVGISFGVLKTDYKATKLSIIETLVNDKIVTEAKAIASGAYNTRLEEDANAAIAAYVAAPLGDLTQVAAAEAKKAAADAAVAKIIVATTKTALQKLIDAQAAKVAAAKTAFTSSNAAAETAVAAYEAAAIVTSADVTAAEALGVIATEKANLVLIAATKDAYVARVVAQDAKVAARKADLAAIATATAAVDAYVAAAYDTLANVATAEGLAATAKAKVALIVDATVKADLTKKIDDKSALVAAKKAQLTGAVVSVNTNSLSCAVLTFDKAMDAATFTSTSVKVNGTGVATTAMTLSEDKKVLTIAYSKNQYDSVKFTLSGLKDVNGVTMANFEQTYVIKDITDPAILSVSVVNFKAIKVYTSEPILVDTATVYKTTDYTNAAITLKINGSLSFAKFTPYADEGYTLVEFFNALPSGVSSITIADAKDKAGFKIAEYTGSINVTADTVAPFAQSTEYVAKNKVKVTFDEGICDGNGNAFGSPTFTFQEAAGTVVSPLSVSYSESTATLTLPGDMTIASTIGFEVKYTNVQDIVGNKTTTAQPISGKTPDDTTIPNVAIDVAAGNEVVVTFDEAVVATAANFVLLASDGTTVKDSTANASFTPNSTNTVFKMKFNTLNAGVNVGSYVVKVTGVRDNSIRANLLADQKLGITSKDNKAPTLITAVTKSFDGAKQVVELVYSEAMDTSFLSVLGNYFVGTATTVTQTLSGIANASVSVNSSTKVTLTIPTTVKYLGIATPIMKDAAANLISGSTIADPNDISDAYTSVLAANLDVTVTGTNTIKVAIKQTAPTAGYTFSTADANAFKFTATSVDVYDVALGVIAAQISADGTYVTLTTSVPLNVDATITNPVGSPAGIYNVSLWIDGSTVKDQNGQAISIAKADDISVVDKMGATQQTTTASNNKITVAFNEAVQSTVAGSLESAFTLKNGTTTLIPFVDYTATITVDGKIEITVTKIAGVTYAGEKTINVALTNTSYIKDIAGNSVTAAAAKDVKVTQ